MTYTTPPGLDDILQMAEHALRAIPSSLRRKMDGVTFIVEQAPTEDLVEEMGLESPWDLTGLYRGTPLTRKSVLDAPGEPDTILLFREPILLEWIETGVDLSHLVRNVLIHEIGHHFGFSDADIERLERED